MASQNSIQSKQNQDWSLKLLAAQRQLYSEAKALRKYRTWAATGVAMTGLFVGTIWPGTLTVVGPIGALVAVAERLIASMERHRIRVAANVQEQFDTEVFGLPWNNMATGSKVEPERISSAQARFKGDRAKLLDWYPSTSGIPCPNNVLVCQRTSLYWDSNLRLGYSALVVASLVLLAALTLALGLIRHLSLLEFLLLYLPPLSAFIGGVDVAIQHGRHANDQRELKERVESVWGQALQKDSTVTLPDCRVIQDCIYRLRTAAPSVPDWWYQLRRERYQDDMIVAAQRMVKEYNARRNATP